MNIKSFENDIDPKILSRGKAYFNDDMVENLEKIDENNWEAEVLGSDIYYVSVKLAGDEIMDWDCDCPYDWGAICKHCTAVFFAIRKNINKAFKKKVNSKTSPKSKKKTKEQQLEEILNSAKLNDLKEFIQQPEIQLEYFPKLLSFLIKEQQSFRKK